MTKKHQKSIIVPKAYRAALLELSAYTNRPVAVLVREIVRLKCCSISLNPMARRL